MRAAEETVEKTVEKQGSKHTGGIFVAEYMRKVFLLSSVLALCLLCGCSTQMKDDGDKAAATQVMPGITEEQPQIFALKKGQIKEMGEPVYAIDVQNGEIVSEALLFTINKAAIFYSAEDAGLDAADVLPASEDLQDENGELKPSVKLMVIDLTAENLCALPDRNITEISVLCACEALPQLTGESRDFKFWEVFPGEPAYFSDPGKREKDYYSYRLPEGRRKELKVAWYVDTEKYNPENLYLTFNADEYQKYIRLVF